MSNVSGIIKSIQDIMRKDVGVDGDAQRISQLVWMFFLKIYDDREAEIEVLEDDYKSPLPEHLRWRNWAADPEGMTGDELSDFVSLQLFPTLKTKLNVSGESGQRALVIRNIFEDAYNYMKSGTLIRQVINKICEIDFNNTQDRHTFGSIYEQILKDLQSAGNAGEFYTPAPSPNLSSTGLTPSSKKPCSTPPAAPAASLPAQSTTRKNATPKPPGTAKSSPPASTAWKRKPCRTCSVPPT